MSFTYRDGTPLIKHAVFHVNASFTAPIIFRDYAIDMSSLTNNRIVYSANLQSGSNQLGTIKVSVLFDRVQRPKITVNVQPSPALKSAGYNVLWIVHGTGTVARFQGARAGFDFANSTLRTSHKVAGTSLEVGSSGGFGNWRVWAVVDWSDAPRGAQISFGRFAALSYLDSPVAVVTFPANLTVIDPTIVGQSSLTGTALSDQRRTFFDGTYYWALYHDGSNTVYQYSNDGRTWINGASILWPYGQTATWFSSGNVYAQEKVTRNASGFLSI